MGQHRGFTLIELIITVTVLAIIATMAVPSFNHMILRQNLKKSTQELTQVLADARAKAALERREITVRLNTTLSANTPTQLNWAPNGKVILKTGSPTSIVFLPTGLVKNATNDTSFTLCEQNSGTLSKTISISKMGTIQQSSDGTCR